jgi:hypothetical protein
MYSLGKSLEPSHYGFPVGPAESHDHQEDDQPNCLQGGSFRDLFVSLVDEVVVSEGQGRRNYVVDYVVRFVALADGLHFPSVFEVGVIFHHLRNSLHDGLEADFGFEEFR